MSPGRPPSRSLRVLHVIPAVADRYGGPSQAAVAICRGLEAVGVESLLATTDADGAGRLRVERGRPTRFRGVPSVFFRRRLGEALKFASGLRGWLRDHLRAFDVVHVHSVFSHACVAAGAACRRQGVPYVVRPLGTLDPWSLKTRRLRKRVFWSLFARRLLTGAAAVHYTADGERRLAEEGLGLVGGVVVPLGVDADRLAADAAAGRLEPSLKERPFVLALGRLHPKKNLELLVECFLRARQQAGAVAWRLVLAGEGERAYEERLRSVVRRAGAQEAVRFAGWVTGPQKAALLRGAALFALPSHQENFGIAAVEAMALGTPALLSPGVNLAAEVAAAEAGWVVEPTRQALTAALVDLLAQPDALSRRGGRAAQLVRDRFAPSAVARALKELYLAVSSGRPPTASATSC